MKKEETMHPYEPLVIRENDPLEPAINVGFVVLALCIACFGTGYWRFASAQGRGPSWPIHLCAAATAVALATCAVLTALGIMFPASV